MLVLVHPVVLAGTLVVLVNFGNCPPVSTMASALRGGATAAGPGLPLGPPGHPGPPGPLPMEDGHGGLRWQWLPGRESN